MKLLFVRRKRGVPRKNSPDPGYETAGIPEKGKLLERLKGENYIWSRTL